MSHRVLKKLGLADKGIPNVIEESDKNKNSKLYTSLKASNRFTALDFENGLESGSDDGTDEIKSPNLDEDEVPVKNDKKRKKKKKKKNVKNEHTINNTESEDDIDKIVREIDENNEIDESSLERIDQSCAELEQDDCEILKLLHVDPQNLNINNELKRIFGAKVLEGTSTSGRALRRKRMFKTVLSAPKKNWPPYSKIGLSMVKIPPKNHIVYFKYICTDEYKEVEKRLIDCVKQLDMDGCVAMLNLHSYHPCVSIQVSEFCIQNDEHSIGTELLEWTLYSLEHSFHPDFSILKAACRLNYNIRENRTLFVGLFKYMLSVGKRSCYRTALNLNKVILALNPMSDPTASILTIDYYALKAKEYKWLLEFIHRWNPLKMLLSLPNFRYSKALAFYYLKDREAADQALIDALLYFPGVLYKLVLDHHLKMDTSVVQHPFFNIPDELESIVLYCFIDLYLDNSAQIFKEPQILAWLESCAKKVIEILDCEYDNRAKLYSEKRRKQFQRSLPLNVLRHLTICRQRRLINRNVELFTLHYDPDPPEIRRLIRPTSVTTSSSSSSSSSSSPSSSSLIHDSIAYFLRSLDPYFIMQSNTDFNRNEIEAVNGDFGENEHNNEDEPAGFRINIGNVLDTILPSWRQASLIDHIRSFLHGSNDDNNRNNNNDENGDN